MHMQTTDVLTLFNWDFTPSPFSVTCYVALPCLTGWVLRMGISVGLGKGPLLLLLLQQHVPATQLNHISDMWMRGGKPTLGHNQMCHVPTGMPPPPKKRTENNNTERLQLFYWRVHVSCFWSSMHKWSLEKWHVALWHKRAFSCHPWTSCTCAVQAVLSPLFWSTRWLASIVP